MASLLLTGYLVDRLPATTDLGRHVHELMDAVSTIAADNKTPFFPAYTDHGVAHLQAVMDWCVHLTPEETQSLLSAEDAAVIVGGVLLHDLAMHLHEPGFVRLVEGDLPWPAPLPWFDHPQGTRPADRPWPELWQAFKAEARHFDHATLVRVLGPDHKGVPRVVHDEALDVDALTRPDRLIIGEFLRRHHARLAHEIAVYGFPGLDDAFPVTPSNPRNLRELRQLMGLVARSHNENLRLVLDHLRARHNSLKPHKVHIPFVSALVRIADFAQLGADRAPLLLLRITAPQSPVSIDAWANHQAVSSIDFHDGDDPTAIRIDVSTDIELSTYLQLEELFAGFQDELDICSAVLSETYGRDTQLGALRLTKQRLRTNLTDPAFRDDLPFEPRRSRLHSAEDMFRLVIHDLYGERPDVAGRELIQNAADAVRERWRLEETRPDIVVVGPDVPPDPEDSSVDVFVEVIVDKDDAMIIRVTDRGVGMTADTLAGYYLKAAASFGPSASDLDGIDPVTATRYAKAGRFGIGVLASFLLGDEVHIRTRHVNSAAGYELTANVNSDLTPIHRVTEPIPIGTQVTIPVSPAARRVIQEANYGGWNMWDTPPLSWFAASVMAWYAQATPRAMTQVRDGHHTARFEASAPTSIPGVDVWADVDTPLDRVRWSASNQGGKIAHNGIWIFENREDPEAYRLAVNDYSDGVIRSPELIVEDASHQLPLTLSRYALRSPQLSFEHELLRSITHEIITASFIRGDAAVFGAGYWLRPILSEDGWMPALPDTDALLPGSIISLEFLLDSHSSPPTEDWQGYETLAMDHIWVDHAVQDSELLGLYLIGYLNDVKAFSHHRSMARLTTRRLDNAVVMRAGHEAEGLSDWFDGSTTDSREVPYGHLAIYDDLSVTSHGYFMGKTLFSEAGHPAIAPLVDLCRTLQARAVLATWTEDAPDERLGPQGHDLHAPQMLAQLWMDIVGGLIPYGEEERLSLFDEVLAKHPELIPHVERQRRYAELGLSPAGGDRRRGGR